MNKYFNFVFLFVCLLGNNYFALSSSAMSDDDKREYSELCKIANLELRLERLDRYLLSHSNSARLIGYRAEIDNALLNYDDTIRDATKYFQLNKEPVVAQVCKVRAQAYTQKKEFNKALNDLLLAKKLAPSDGETALMLGVVYKHLGQDQLALTEFDRAIALKFDGTYYARSSLLFKLNRPSEGTLDCITATRKSKNLSLPDGIVFELHKQEKYNDIVVLCDGLIKAKLVRPIVYSTKADALYMSKRYEQALLACDQSVAAGYDRLDRLRFDIYAAMKQSDKAINQLKRLMKAKPNDLSLFLLRADQHMENRHYDLALADFLKAKNLVAKDKAAQAKQAECYFRIGEYGQAASQYAVLNPSIANQSYYKKLYVETLTYEGLSLKALNKYEHAIKVLDRAIKLKPLSSTLLSYRAECYGRMHNYTQADSDLTDAIALSPDMYALYCARGAYRYQAGTYEAAASDFTKAMSDKRSRGMAYVGRAKAYRKLGQLDKAASDERAAAAESKSLEADLFKQ